MIKRSIWLRTVMTVAAICAISINSVKAQQARELECVLYGYLHWYVKVDYQNSRMIVGPFMPGQTPEVESLPAQFHELSIEAHKWRGGYVIASFVLDRFDSTLLVIDYDPRNDAKSTPCTPYRPKQREL